MWEIIDDNGTIHSGSEEEMTYAFDVMTHQIKVSLKEVKKYTTDWTGDLKLVEVHNIYR